MQQISTSKHFKFFEDPYLQSSKLLLQTCLVIILKIKKYFFLLFQLSILRHGSVKNRIQFVRTLPDVRVTSTHRKSALSSNPVSSSKISRQTLKPLKSGIGLTRKFFPAVLAGKFPASGLEITAAILLIRVKKLWPSKELVWLGKYQQLLWDHSLTITLPIQWRPLGY